MKLPALSLALALLTVALGAQVQPRRPIPSPFEPGASQSPPSPPPPAVQPKFLEKQGFMTPESVLHDETADVYLVSNICGSPTEADNNGFIARLKTDGALETLKWIEGGKNGVVLDAPKGMAIVKDTLWVADITFVRKFDRKTGKPLGSVEVKGATFLNDVAARADGSLLVTDTGLKPDFSESGTHALVTIGTDEKVTVEPTPGKQPNGITVLPSGASCYVTWNTGELIVGKAVVGKMPKAQLDGIVALAEDHFLISSWEGQCVYDVTRKKDQKDPAITVLIKEAKAPADLGYDRKRRVLLLPMFQDDKVVLWPL